MMRAIAIFVLRIFIAGFTFVLGPLVKRAREHRPLMVVGYRGFGSQNSVFISGRAMVATETSATRAPGRNRKRSLWLRLRDTYRLLVTLKVPGAKVRVRFHGVEKVVAADDNGFFTLVIDSFPSVSQSELWHPYEIELLAPQPGQSPMRGEILIPPTESARRVIISDIDDTVIETGVVSKIRMLKNLFDTDPARRLPVAGIGAFYRALHHGVQGDEHNPLIYVSRGPWSIYPILDEVFRRNSIPVGPVLLLRDWGISYDHPLPRRAPEHKKELIDLVFRLYSDLPVLLIGDSGQQDPEIYLDAARRFPGRVEKVYIRNLGHHPRRDQELERIKAEFENLGVSFVLAPNSLGMAEDAAAHGWIAERAVAAIASREA